MRFPVVLLVFYLTLPSFSTLAQTRLLTGRVLDQQTSAPVPFASVGIHNQPLGTVADEQGRFHFSVPTAAATEQVFVSCVGYQTASLPLAAFGSSEQVIRLVPTQVLLGAVTVRPGNVRTQTFGRTASSTLMGAAMYTEPSLVSDELAKEQGTIISLAPEVLLQDFNFHVAFNRFKSVKFRLLLYSVNAGRPNQPLLTRDIRFDVTQPRGWVRVDLRPYHLYLQNQRKVAVTLQWLQSEALEGQPKAFGISAVPAPGHSILVRDKSQAAWREIKPGYLSFYFTADSYRPEKQPATPPTDAYTLPDSLRYLQYLGAASSPTLTNPQHYGDNATVGRYVAVKDGRLYYERYGSGAPLLLLHGNGQSIAAFQAQIGELARHFEVFAVDTRAHGRSQDMATEALSYELFAEDVRQLLDTLHLPQVAILGWSDGGNTALMLALHHPSRVRRMALMGANLFPGPEAIAPDFLQLLRRQLHQAESQPDAASVRQARRIRLLLQEPQLTLAAVEAIRVPTLVMAGQHDVIREAHTRAIAGHIPGAQLLILPGATHYAPQEAPREFNEAVLRFLQAQ